ncbi:MAG: FAD-dependent monooxygenase [Cytophagales bacterium]|nr:FAD-dependent monooxygenase [Rhizobacter sp.]
MKRFDVCVQGAGIVGQSLALSLARQGLQVALVTQAAGGVLQEMQEAQETRADVRAYALNAASIELLRGLKVWETLPPHAATAVYDMHIEGDSPAGLLEFSAWQQKFSELAWITDAAVLEQSLASAVRYAPHITLTDSPVEASLTALCEGKASAAREALGVVWDRQDYGHGAIAARLIAEHPHRNTARQWFRQPDVLALLPFDAPQPEHSFALVWSAPDARVHELLALDAKTFEAALQQATGGACGELRLAGERASWPLMLARAQAWCGTGWVLLGDAAHVVHPLAGQGLNLGLADVAALSQVVSQREPWRALGDARLLRRYERQRQVPTRAMGQLTDGLLRLFSQEQPAVRELRNRGMSLVNHLPPLKRWLTSRALGS